MARQRLTASVSALLLGALVLSGCGGGNGGSASVTPTPSPTPTTTPTPTPTPAATLQALAHQPPVGVLLALLLTDGSVMVQANPAGAPGASAGDFYRLTPDANGSYAAGSWTHLAPPPAGYAPYASAEAVLADGRVLFVGGEYNQDNYSFGPTSLTNMSAVFDPVANSWTMIAPPPGQDYIGDVPSSILPDGRFIFGSKLSKAMWSLDPATLAWSAIPATGKSDNFSEEGFTLLPGGNVLVVDMVNTPQSEHFVPATNGWIADGPTPVSLTSPTPGPASLGYGPAPLQTVGGVSYGPAPAGVYFPPGEIGPALLRPDGSVFATGSAAPGHIAHTAIYRPGATAAVAGSWLAGPDFPAGEDAGDSSAALLPNGNVLVAGVTGALYEFDGTTLRKTANGPANPGSGVPTFLLPLPSGQVLVLTPTLNVMARLYNPFGGPLAGWLPTIASVPTSLTRGQSYSLTGTQLNGLSEAAAYGDELSAATNYPLVRLTNNASGHVVYARTHHHSMMGVATGATLVTTHFDVPAGAETGATTLVVVANGLASAPVAVTVS
ncbi:hypothetical protein QH494_17335 [Sphingomonas sp. AR_OL41]|uniref:hypothetical protein n=1 Tax=Sphingomonas sp. AR_OL41 TaxID=3042729 RepID=UPI0024810379|nr:hypothetical protein [Sphingomonas sp. AR_OL41]MDH7973954.1 hypothetical protein [Sphingomonas sp. AR_OL41]